LVAVGGGLADLVGRLHAFDHLAEDRVMALEGRLVAEADEELTPRVVYARGAQDGHDAADEGAGGELGLQQAEPARPVLRGLGRVLRQRIAPLDDASRDDPVERGALKTSEVGDVLESAPQLPWCATRDIELMMPVPLVAITTTILRPDRRPAGG